MAKPRKEDIVPDQDYLKEWYEYQKKSPSKKPILLPISIKMETDGLERLRIKSTDMALKQADLMTEFEAHCKKPGGELEGRYGPKDFQTMLDEYNTFFINDSMQGAIPPTPLDLKINRPVWILFYLPHPSWKFSEGRQFSTENDRDDFARNFEKITTFENNDWLLLANHCRSTPKGLKYNLHVTVTQVENGVTMETPIIIDPGSENDTRGSGGQESIP